jgi:predicted nucleic acid-binding protein
MILLDTSVLSLAYRRKYQDHTHKPVAVKTLEQMIIDNEPLALPAVVVQEFLTGLKEETQFQKLQKVVAGFPVILANLQHHLEAAKIANACRRAGVITSATDCLIAAIAIEQQATLFTTDLDFSYMATHCPLRLFQIK